MGEDLKIFECVIVNFFFSAKYNFYIQQFPAKAQKAQQQVFDILKFFYASALYLSDELIKDRFLFDEFSYFILALNSGIRTRYV